MVFTNKTILSIVIGLSIVQAAHATPAKKNDLDQNAYYFRAHVMAEFEQKCNPDLKVIDFNAYNACLGNHDRLIELPFLKKLLQNSKDKIFISQDSFVRKCKTHMKNDLPKTGVTQYCQDVYQDFVKAHEIYKTMPNDFEYHLD